MAEHPDAPRALRRYKPSGDGSDALLQFGRHKGLSLKQIQKKDPAYLDRLIMSDVDSELKAIARDVQHQVKIERDAAELDAASAALIENAGKIGAEMGKAARTAKKCERCDGSGRDPSSFGGYRTCSKCNGSGLL